MSLPQKYVLIFMSMALLLPSTVSLTHIFAHQEQIVCSDFSDSHYHTKKLDCELCKLHSTPFLSFEIYNYNFFQPLAINRKFENSYFFLSDYQKLSFELRGPPVS